MFNFLLILLFNKNLNLEDFKPSIDEQVNFDSSNFYIFIKWRNITTLVTLYSSYNIIINKGKI